MADQIPRPKISDGYLGMQAKFNEIGLSTLSHEDPFLEVNGNAIEIVIGYNQPTRFTTKLLLCNSGGQDNPNFVMVNNLQGRMCYTITVPQIGYYKFQIYALPTSEAGPNMVNVFNYVLFFKELTDEFRAFPKQYPPWKNGCYMWEPRGIPHGCRAPGVPFKVHLPNAQQVRFHCRYRYFIRLLNLIFETLPQKLVTVKGQPERVGNVGPFERNFANQNEAVFRALRCVTMVL